MTRIEFHFNVEDKTQKIVQLCEKILAKKRWVIILTSQEEVAEVSQSIRVDRLAQDFEAKTAAIEVVADVKDSVQDEVLINLLTEQSTIFSRFDELIEIVGMDESDKAFARKRYQFYKDRGYPILSVNALA
jgi:DNA polymerase III subunit chi